MQLGEQESNASRRIGFFRRQGTPEEKLGLRNTLNIIFMIAAVMTVVIYFLPQRQYSQVAFFACGFFAVIVKMIETVIRAKVQNKIKRNEKRRNHTA